MPYLVPCLPMFPVHATMIPFRDTKSNTFFFSLLPVEKQTKTAKKEWNVFSNNLAKSRFSEGDSQNPAFFSFAVSLRRARIVVRGVIRCLIY